MSNFVASRLPIDAFVISVLNSKYQLVCPEPDRVSQKTYADLTSDDTCHWGHLPTRAWMASSRASRDQLLALQGSLRQIFISNGEPISSAPQWFTQYYSPVSGTY